MTEPLEDRIASHEKRLDKQDERLSQHSDRLERHDERLVQDLDDIQELKRFDKEKNKRLLTVEANYEKLENTIVNENKDMRTFFQSNMDKLWDLTMSRDKNNHEGRKMEHEINKTKVERWGNIVFKMLGSGGIIYIIIQAIITGMGG